MGRLQAFYERRVFPHVLELAMRQLGELRAPTLADARGEVLEIGFGTGLNLPHYPAGVAKLVTADPMEALSDRVRAMEIYREVTTHETDSKRISEATKRLSDLSGTR